jgi:hypothetical protein
MAYCDAKARTLFRRCIGGHRLIGYKVWVTRRSL